MTENQQVELAPEVLAELGLQRQPFAEPDPQALFIDERLRVQLDAVLQHIELSPMMHVVCAAPGAGKTCLVLALLAGAGARMEVFVARGAASLNSAQVLTDMLQSFGDDGGVGDGTGLEDRLARALTSNLPETRPAVLLIDDADRVDGAELYRLLASIEQVNAQARDGVRLVLVGRPTLASTLATIDSPLLQAGRVFETVLEPLSERRTEAYLEHRLLRAGGSYAFTPDTIAWIHAQSEGLPAAIDEAAVQALTSSLASQEEVPELPTGPAGATFDIKQKLGDAAAVASAKWRVLETLPRAVRWGVPAIALLLVALALIFSGDEPGNGTVTQPLAVPPQSAEPASAPEPAPQSPDQSPPLATPSGLHDQQWLTSRPEGSYVIQLIGMADRAALVGFSQRHRLGDQAAMFATRREGGDWFVLVYGLYPDADSARAAIGQLDQGLRAQSPWIRSIASIRQAIADQTP